MRLRTRLANLKARASRSVHNIKTIKIYANESVNVAIVEGLKRRGVEAFSAKARASTRRFARWIDRAMCTKLKCGMSILIATVKETERKRK